MPIIRICGSQRARRMAERELLALGATRVHGERETGFRVFTDPAGHPFCIVFGQPGTD
jgi:Glyoxalase-like domain